MYELLMRKCMNYSLQLCAKTGYQYTKRKYIKKPHVLKISKDFIKSTFPSPYPICASGIMSSTTTKIMAPAAKARA